MSVRFVSTAMKVRADQVMLNDVVIFESRIPLVVESDGEPYLGTVHALKVTNEDVTISFYGPQNEDREVTLGTYRQINVVRMIEER